MTRAQDEARGAIPRGREGTLAFALVAATAAAFAAGACDEARSAGPVPLIPSGPQAPSASDYYERGYSPGTEAECAPLREALHEGRDAIVGQFERLPGDGRTPLEAALAERVHAFLERQCYRLPGWVGEDGVHLTGVEGGGDTHGWVRAFYSPEVAAWLREGRPAGKVPARAVIVKERYRPMGGEGPRKFKLLGWQPMVRRADDSHDGWFWGDIAQEEARHGELRCDATRPAPASGDAESAVPDCRPSSGFGLTCLRCHGSAPSDLTFAQRTHLAESTGGGNERTQVIYDYRRAWLPDDAANPDYNYEGYRSSKPAPYVAAHPERAALPRPLGEADGGLVALFFPAGAPASLGGDPHPFPPRALDHVVAPPGDPGPSASFLTSDQCWGCHSGVPHVAQDTVDYATGTLARHTPGMSMIAAAGTFSDGRDRWADLSPYGEWSVSLMGLAGKDPVFFAQHEWETTERAACAPDTTQLCYTCHGVAGRRQLELDAPARKFEHSMVSATASDADGKYGALARDGVSCSVCHRVGADGLGTPASYTGAFTPAPPGEVNGPYQDDVRDEPMKAVLGLTPEGEGGASDVVTSSALCGSCHAVRLPVYRVGSCELLGYGYEQATFLEWRNSDFRKNDAFVTDEGHSGPTPRTCQDCHMPRSFRGEELARKAASIEDADFPTENLAGLDGVHGEVKLEVRKPFSRHSLNGINLFTLGLFQQFPQALGIADYDYMTNQYGEPIALAMATAIESGKTLAAETASVGVVRADRGPEDLLVEVEVKNLAGHRLPSGVAFRRVVLNLEVQDATGRALWASGRIDARGLVVGQDGTSPLATELSTEAYEPHRQEIRSPDEAQIYEEKVRDSEGHLTTSFVGIAEHSKDNRLLPKGFRLGFEPTKEGGQVPPGLEPHGVEGDPDYAAEGAGPGACGCDRVTYRVPNGALAGAAARVVARLYYQALPPYYLRDRFQLAGEGGAESMRLAQLVTRLRTDGDEGGIRGWKVQLAEASRPLE